MQGISLMLMGTARASCALSTESRGWLDAMFQSVMAAAPGFLQEGSSLHLHLQPPAAPSPSRVRED